MLDIRLKFCFVFACAPMSVRKHNVNIPQEIVKGLLFNIDDAINYILFAIRKKCTFVC